MFPNSLGYSTTYVRQRLAAGKWTTIADYSGRMLIPSARVMVS